MGTKNDPGAHDCHAKADDDEPIFTLRAKDIYAATTIMEWVAQSFYEQPIEKLVEAIECAKAMVDWRLAQALAPTLQDRPQQVISRELEIKALSSIVDAAERRGADIDWPSQPCPKHPSHEPSPDCNVCFPIKAPE